MQNKFLVAAAGLVAVTSLAAQGTREDRSVNFVPVHTPINSGSLNTSTDLRYWVANESANVWLGGTTYSNRASRITTSGPTTDVSAEGVILLQEDNIATSGTFDYHAIGVDGQWKTQSMPGVASQIVANEQMAFLVSPANNDVYVFLPWRQGGSWFNFPVSDPLNLVVTTLPRAQSVVISDTDPMTMQTTLSAFSAFGILPAVLSKSGTYLPGTGSDGRVSLAFATGANEISIYSSLVQRWTTITLQNTTLANVLVTEYDQSTFMVDDGPNTVVVYSGISGLATRISLPIHNILAANSYYLDDQAAVFIDNPSQTAWVVRVSDNFVLQRSPAVGLIIDNEWSGFETGTQVSILSGVVSDGGLQTIDYAGQTLIDSDSNDGEAIYVTDAAVYAYSSFTNRWSRLAYQGTFDPNGAGHDFGGEDWFAHLETSSHVYGFATRDNSWHTLAKPANSTTTINTDDGCMFVTFTDNATNGTTVYAFGSDSRGFRNLDLHYSVNDTNNHVYLDLQDCYVAAIQNDPNGPGSVITFYSRFTDQVEKVTTTYRILPSTEVFEEDQVFIVSTPSELISFTTFTSATTQPQLLDNGPYHLVPGSPDSLFIVRGPANSAGALVVGLGRLDSGFQLPGVVQRGLLMIDTSATFVAPGIGFGANGTLTFELPTSVVPGVYYVQPVTLESATGTLVWGNQYPHQIFG